MLTHRGIVICIALISIQLNALSQAINISQHLKISPLLESRLESATTKKIGVVLIFDKENYPVMVDQKDILASFQKYNRHHLSCLLSKNQILALAETPEVIFIELLRKPNPEFKQEGLDLTLNAVRYLQHIYPALSGTGMSLSIKENLFDTNDIDFKNRIIALELASSHIDMHATSMASIVAGGGNSSPTAKGVAWDANISSSDFSNLFPDPDDYFIDDSISVQNHSYGTGIENYYGVESATYDEQANALPWLLHVFSAGNIGNQTPEDGKYEGLQGWANLTGQFKQSKNSITVGATDSLNNVVSLSSRGPAYDGRIKPEMVAYGHGGSSGAAAIVTGTAALIQQAYHQLHNAYPYSSLLKAVLINSATDIESPGPDFKSGFGAVNAERAVSAIKNHNYIAVQLQANDTWEWMSTIPENVATASISIAWIDPPANVLDPTALVHDIDLEIENLATGEKWLPWIINSSPHEDSLLLPAKTGRDTLNNFEKITLSYPPPGEIIIRLISKELVTPYQIVSMVVQYDTVGHYEWTFPTRDDHLKPGRKNLLRWYSAGAENGSISFRYIGDDWQLIADDVDASVNWYNYSVPDKYGLAQLMWTSGTSAILSDTFVVSSPLEPDVALLCEDSLVIQWENPGMTDNFQVLKLGERHLELYQTVSDTFLTLHPDFSNPYYAVVPLFGNVAGPQSYAFDFTIQGAGCYLETFYFLHVLNDRAFFGANLSAIDQIDSVLFEEKINGVFVTLQSLNQIDSTTLFFTSNILKQGINDFRLRIILNDGREIISQEARVYFNKNNTVLLFPNPVRAGEELSLLIRDIDEFDILILDIQGKVIFRFNDLESPVTLPPLNLFPGIYIYKIASPQGDVHGKMLVY